MAPVDIQLDFFGANRDHTNPARRRRTPFVTALWQLPIARNVRRMTDFRLENTLFCLRTRPWFRPEEEFEIEALERELKRRRVWRRRKP